MKKVKVKILPESTPNFWKSFSGETGIIIKRGNSRKGLYGIRYQVRFNLERWFRKEELDFLSPNPRSLRRDLKGRKE